MIYSLSLVVTVKLMHITFLGHQSMKTNQFIVAKDEETMCLSDQIKQFNSFQIGQSKESLTLWTDTAQVPNADHKFF